jgi:hypothetical protein
MTDCTEPRLARGEDGREGEGQEGMPKGHSMTDCTEPRLARGEDGREGEGQEGMPKGSAA